MNENYVGPSSGFSGAAANQTLAQQENTLTPKPMGLSSSIQGLVAEAHEAANLAGNLLGVLGLSTPEKEGSANRPAESPAEVIRLATSMLRSANEKLGAALQHISS